jgi:hypothetical protein
MEKLVRLVLRYADHLVNYLHLIQNTGEGSFESPCEYGIELRFYKPYKKLVD